jgi:hypothetical protein
MKEENTKEIIRSIKQRRPTDTMKEENTKEIIRSHKTKKTS